MKLSKLLQKVGLALNSDLTEARGVADRLAIGSATLRMAKTEVEAELTACRNAFATGKAEFRSLQAEYKDYRAAATDRFRAIADCETARPGGTVQKMARLARQGFEPQQ